MFEAIGLNADEQQAYLELLEHPGRTRAEISSALPGWSPAKTTRTLNSLVSHGLATRLAGTPQKYSATSPDVALESLTSQQIERVRRVQQVIPDLMDRFWHARRQTGATDFVEILSDDRESNDRRARQLLSAATNWVRGFERPPHKWTPQSIDAAGLDALLEADATVERDALTKGVHYQVLYDQVEVDDPARWPDLQASLDAGEEARVYAGLPLKMVLFDDWAATTPLIDASGEYAGLVVVHKSSLLDALSALFDSYWIRAVPLIAAHNHISASEKHTVSDPQEERLISMLCGGLTDTSIARTLGVSRSTVQRRVNHLMAQHGARTRLQLGLQLGRLR